MWKSVCQKLSSVFSEQLFDHSAVISLSTPYKHIENAYKHSRRFKLRRLKYA